METGLTQTEKKKVVQMSQWLGHVFKFIKAARSIIIGITVVPLSLNNNTVCSRSVLQFKRKQKNCTLCQSLLLLLNICFKDTQTDVIYSAICCKNGQNMILKSVFVCTLSVLQGTSSPKISSNNEWGCHWLKLFFLLGQVHFCDPSKLRLQSPDRDWSFKMITFALFLKWIVQSSDKADV